ncbi:ABC transporter permease subunit [Aliihoeflea aestuarii]|jgi:peptide/nickel transport system permease protein|uniref:ABC transporter permease n=1 Tax=Aliihoeflea aestuarii TaxID=453840 RepID=UPI002093343C|nr:ABC transporter permease [Aliihoeflea aestuarii]MCO6390817.1 ABC transporter permease subunit [Aliihoeflea aestuarii]
MIFFIMRRLITLLPTLIVPLFLVFTLLHLSPGDPAAVMLGADATAQQVQALREQLGLNDPFLVQLFTWLGRMATLDLGDSIFLRMPVMDAILQRLEPTIMLTLYALTIAVVVGMVSGIVAAVNRNGVLDQVSMTVAMVGVSMPEFWFGLMLIVVFAVEFRLFPVAGYTPLDQGFWACIWSLTLPAVSVGLVQAGFIARITRSSMLDVIGEDFIRTARAKGLPSRVVILRHALKNALIPVLTVIGITFAVLMGGAIAIETVFNIPGIGRLLVNAVARRDYPVIQGVVLFMALTFIFINLFVDILYGFIDPRVKNQ